MHFSFFTVAAVLVAGSGLVIASPTPAEAATDAASTAAAANAPFGINLGQTWNNVVA